MNRRGFISLLGAGAAGLALDRAIPFNRVWSFPKEIVIPKAGDILSMASVNIVNKPLFQIGDIITIADWPGRFVISRIHSDENVELYSADQNFLMRGFSASELTPLLIGDTIPTEVSFA
jgi:hypothetical protein